MDGFPIRAVGSVNLRYEDKAIVDLLQSWWSMRSGRPLKQWDAMSIVLRLALENPDADLPEGARDLLDA